MSVLQNGNNVIFKLFVIFGLWEDKVSCENVNCSKKIEQVPSSNA